MPKTARVAPGGFVYHVLNGSMGRMHMFRKELDFEAFERVMVEAHLRQPIRILSYYVLVVALARGSGRRAGRLASTLL
jgi:putative transposase